MAEKQNEKAASDIADASGAHTQYEVSTINEYLAAVDDRLLRKVKDVYSRGFTEEERLKIGDVPESISKRIKSLLGIDTTGYTFSILIAEYNT